MNCPRFVLRSLSLLALLAAGSSTVEAQYPGGCGWGYNGGLFGSVGRGLPPYFSLFPPVYYSYPVPRSYGYSPFAYPYGTPTPEIQVETVQSKLMINPYVPRAKVTEPAADATTGPLTLINPFVPRDEGAGVELAQKP